MKDYQLLAAANLICDHLAGTICLKWYNYKTSLHIIHCCIASKMRTGKESCHIYIDKLLLQLGVEILQQSLVPASTPYKVDTPVNPLSTES